MPSGNAPARDHWYFSVSRPMMILRVPLPMPRWPAVLKALTPVMKAHGYRQKDLRWAELIPAPHRPWTVEDVHFAERLDLAFQEGDSSELFPGFELHDWQGDRFELVRRALV